MAQTEADTMLDEIRADLERLQQKFSRWDDARITTFEQAKFDAGLALCRNALEFIRGL